jgi:outer membrane receptor protein involved in Fe transport
MRESLRVTTTVLWILSVAVGTLQAQQSRATISGVVTDSSGAAIVGARVDVTNTLRNAVFTTRSNESGFFTAPSLTVGEYSVSVGQLGFKTAVRSGIILQVNQTAQVNVVLEIGQLAESVEVVGQAPLVESGSATLGKVIENRRVQEMPISGRNALALILLAPGVKSNGGPMNSGFGERGMQISHMSINGGPNGMNASLLDGATNVHSGGAGEVNISPPVDSIEEFKVQSGNMSAEFGFTAGGVVNLVTRSGGNRLTGSVYEFLRNDRLDAQRVFTTKQAFRYNQFGGAVGGPIRRDKTFFFGLWEEYRFRRGMPFITTTPTPQQRAGDFSDLFDINGRLIQLYDPFSTRPNPSGSGWVRDPLPKNAIPTDRLDPVALKLQELLYPLPNRAPSDPFTNSNNYFNMQKIGKLMRSFSGKVDHRIADRNTLFGRFAYYEHRTDSANDDPGPWPNPLKSKRDDIARMFNFVINDAHTFSPTLISEFRGGLSGARFTYMPRSFGKNIPQMIGLPASHPQDLIPNLSNGLAGGFDQQWGYRHSTAWNAQNILTKIVGSHTLKMGVEYRLNLAFEDQRNPASGSFTFAAGLTGNPQTAQAGSSYATFLLGAVSQAELSSFVGSTLRGHSVSAFVQEDWRVTRRLTINLGVRYDFQQQPYEINLGASNFDPFSPDPVSGLMGRMVFGGTDGHRGNFMREDYNDFAPRVGIAYDLTGSGRTVLRSGYGLYYPYMFHRYSFPLRDGFLRTSTVYTPPGNNTNLPAFRFRDGLPYLNAPPLGRNLGSNGRLGQTVGFMQAGERTPDSQQVSLGIQRQLSQFWLIDASYSGNFGHHFGAGAYDYNQLDPQHLELRRSLQDRVPNPYAGKVPGSLGDATLTRLQSLRPYPYYANINVAEPHLGNFSYHSLVFSLEKRMSQGLTVLFSHTWSKLLSDSIRSAVDFGGNEQTTTTGYQDGKYNRAGERGLDPTDTPQRAVISALYELPFGRGKRWGISSPIAEKMLSGWQLNTIGTLQSGVPLTVRGASNFLADRPNSTGTSAQLPRSGRSAERWFDTTQFVNPPEYTWGNVGRVLPDVRTPATHNWDLSVIKNTRLTERFSLQFRGEAFNFINHVVLRAPNVSFVPGPDGKNRSGTFGVITNARDARVIQFGLKLLF